MKRITLQILGAISLIIMLCSMSYAAEVNFHGFVRSSYDISSSTAKYLEHIDDKGSWGGSQVGLVFSTSINPQWSVAGQYHFIAREGEVSLDWGFATFQVNESNKIKFGRQKYPLGLVTENIDIGITYPWVRPPREFYNTELGDESANIALESFDGVSLVYSTGDEWEFTVQPFVGQFNYKEVASNNLREMLGLKVQANNDIVTLQAGVSDSKMTVVGGVTDQSKTTVNVGALVEMDDLLAYVEYADTSVDNSDEFDTNAAYASVAYNFGKFQPHITFAQLEGQKAAGAATGALDQTSSAIGVAYHYNPSTVFKAQWKNIKPDDPTTDGLIGALPAGETSADIYSFTMDVFF